MNEATPNPSTAAWSFSIEKCDAVAVPGALLILGGAYAIHPGLALATAGAGLLALAWRLTR